MNYNPELLYLAQEALSKKTRNTEKQAFVPPGGDPAAGGGAPPMDPAAMGGAPPMDPSMMDPSMMGGAPPMDPAMMGGAPPVPGGGGLTADSITQIVQQAVQAAVGGGGGGPGGAGGAGKMAKPDLNTVAIDIFQVKKMLQYLFQTMGIPMPPDILDGPNRDPKTGAPMMPGAPGSTSDPNAPTQAPPAAGQSGAIPAIEPMQPAGPGAVKQSDALFMGRAHTDSFDTVSNKAAALAAIYRRLSNK